MGERVSASVGERECERASVWEERVRVCGIVRVCGERV